MNNEVTIESEIRKLRDRVYGVPISDESWLQVRANWSRPDSVAWLKAKVERPLLNLSK